MSTLYEIKSVYQNLQAMLEEFIADGDQENQEQAREMLTIAAGEFQEKALAYCQVRASILAQAEAIRTEEKRLADLRKSKERQAEALDGRLLEAMLAMGQDKVDLNLFKLRINHSQAVQADEPQALPEEFRRVRIEADKTALAKALKAGQEIPGAVLVPRLSLVIK